MKEPGQQLQRTDEPHYRYWQAFWLSFYSSKLYIDVVKRWKGVGFVYLLLISMVFSIPFSVRLIIELNHYITQNIINPLKSIPPIKIENGRVSVDRLMPWNIQNAQGKTQIIIDTTGLVTKLDRLQNPDLRILITEDTLYFYIPPIPVFFGTDDANSEPTIIEESLSSISNGTMSGEDIMKESNISSLQWLPILSTWPVVFMILFSIHLVILLVFSMMGQLVAQVIFKFYLTYKQTCRLIAVAMTPQLLVLVILITTQWFGTAYSGISLILLILYFCYGVLANRRDSKKLAPR